MKLFAPCLIILLITIFSCYETKAQSDTTVYDFMKMENPPTFVGGAKKFYSFLTKNLKLTPEAIKNDIHGSLTISFIVEKNGKVLVAKCSNSIGFGMEEEVIRVFKLSKWNPGLADGNPVRTNYSIPIRF